MYYRSQQSSPFYAFQQTGLFVREAVGTLSRRNRGLEEDKKVRFFSTSNDKNDKYDIGVNVDDNGNNDSTKSTIPDLYPKYYRNAFHYQTDGWMSHDSAKVYDTSTESLFLGRQDAMQRTALVPLIEHAKKLGTGSDSGSSNRPMKVLEVACGTGRFMTFARDNLPLDSEYTALDLSPFYLDRAREYDSQWRSLRRKRLKEENKNGNGKRNIKIQPASIVQSQAENLPFNDEEFDAVVCVYLFHEIPREVRAQVASEMARVTKKGGKVILTDSTQLGDRPVFDKQIGNFEKMNEPYYKDYIEDFLPNHFEKAGMECLTKTVCSASKTLSFQKK
jgi:ubiquinone/menaquinone biosynthesis C-methylase UbiE